MFCLVQSLKLVVCFPTCQLTASPEPPPLSPLPEKLKLLYNNLQRQPWGGN